MLINSTVHRKSVPVHVTNASGGVDVYIHLFLTLVPDGRECNYVNMWGKGTQNVFVLKH
jgi:hypothetical protein